MKISNLKLINYRNYRFINLEFNKSLNIIYGNNGVGKTNLVEAIYTLSLTKSFRTSNDKLLIKNNELCTKIEGEVENKGVNNYKLIINKEGKKVYFNDNLITKISEYISKINIILLEPEDQMIFTGSPSERRKLINIEISKLYSEYILYLNNYNRILKQRNAYLRKLYNNKLSYDYLNILTNKLIDYGLKIYEYRKEFINNINKYINEKYNLIFENGNLVVEYISSFKQTRENILNSYDKNFNRELTLGKTLFGIHHDDLIFKLDDFDIAERGSNGQKKNAIFSFKLAEISMIKELFNDYPILILDDLFSALDNNKIDNIIRILNEDVQTFITTANLNDIDKNLIKKAKLFAIFEKDNNVTIEEG